jgi:hypothetical protein
MRTVAVRISFLALLIASGTVAQTLDTPVDLAPVTSFDGFATFRDKAGMPKQVALRIRNWIIPNGQRIVRFPEQGLLVVQLRAGSLITTIEGKRQQRAVEEFWTVPPGTAMSIETEQDSVILQVVSLRTANEEQKSQ